MGHNLEFNQQTGTTSFVSSKNMVAWHGLGQVLPNDLLTAEECIKHANLGYEVALTPVKYEWVNPVSKEIITRISDNKFVTHRTDNGNELGTVGSKYHIVQNTSAFDFFDSIMGEARAIYETAGVLGKGEAIFLTAKMPQHITIAGTKDETEIYVVLKSSHDGSGSIKAMVTPVRVVCQNTLNAAIRQAKNTVSIRHTANAKVKLAEAHKLLGITHNYVEAVNEVFNRLHKVKISDAIFNDLVMTLFNPANKEELSTRNTNIIEAVKASYFTGVGQSKILGTGWGAYNGITHYLSHVKSYHNDTSKFESIMEGNSQKIGQQAMDYILQLS